VSILGAPALYYEQLLVAHPNERPIYVVCDNARSYNNTELSTVSTVNEQFISSSLLIINNKACNYKLQAYGLLLDRLASR
jgi:hypothetical protein